MVCSDEIAYIFMLTFYDRLEMFLVMIGLAGGNQSLTELLIPYRC